MCIVALDIPQLKTRAEHWVSVELWEVDLYERATTGEKLLLLLGRTLYILVTAFVEEGIKLRAAALTYTTMLSLVPALAVVFSLFTAFGGLEDTQRRVQEVILDALAAGQRETVLTYLERFVGQVHAGQLGAVGIVFLFITVLSLLASIERAFNDIWGISRDRSWMKRFQVYWPLITLAPILLGASLSITATVQASSVVKQLLNSVPSLKLLTGVGPILLTSLFFTLLYSVMPHTHVRLRFAALGGMVSGSLIVAAQKLYAVYAANALSYSAIYGSLGAIPLFMIWIYVGWVIVLMGATLTFAAQSARSYEPSREVSAAEQQFIALRLMIEACERFTRGEGPTTAQHMLDSVQVQPRRVRRVLDRLTSAGLLSDTVMFDGADAYVPGKPPSMMRVHDVLAAMRGRDLCPASQDPTAESVSRIVQELRSEELNGPGAICMTALFSTASGPSEPSRPSRPSEASQISEPSELAHPALPASKR